MTTTTTTRHDRYGFPITDCRRCGGCGRYSYNQRDGDRCFGCGGSGVVYTKKAAPHAVAWRAAVKEAMLPVGAKLAVGDRIRRYGDPKSTPFVEIVSIVDTGEAVAWTCPTGAADRDDRSTWIVTATRLLVSLADGEVRTISGAELVRRDAKIDPAPYVAQAE